MCHGQQLNWCLLYLPLTHSLTPFTSKLGISSYISIIIHSGWSYLTSLSVFVVCHALLSPDVDIFIFVSIRVAGSLQLLEGSRLLWELHVGHQLFSLAKLDITVRYLYHACILQRVFVGVFLLKPTSFGNLLSCLYSET